jgi:hypothetical protein
LQAQEHAGAFQNRGFPLPVVAHEKIEAGRKVDSERLETAKISELHFGQHNEGPGKFCRRKALSCHALASRHIAKTAEPRRHFLRPVFSRHTVAPELLKSSCDDDQARLDRPQFWKIVLGGTAALRAHRARGAVLFCRKP